MRFVVHQCSALQGAAHLAAHWREVRKWYLLEGDGLGAYNADRMAWIYDQAAHCILPALGTWRPEPRFEDYEPDPEIEPTPVVILRTPVTSGAAENLLPKVIVRRPTLQLIHGGVWEDETLSA